MGQKSINRLSGVAVALFGAAMLLWIIPAHTETVSYGWVKPDTLPKACAWALAGLGLIQALLPKGEVALDGAEFVIVAVAAVLSAGAIWALGKVGFLVAAPVFAALLIAVIRERRIGWIAATIIGAPALIWVVVDLLLGRPLP